MSFFLAASNENQQVSILHVTDEDDQSAELVLETFQMASNEGTYILGLSFFKSNVFYFQN